MFEGEVLAVVSADFTVPSRPRIQHQLVSVFRCSHPSMLIPGHITRSREPQSQVLPE